MSPQAAAMFVVGRATANGSLGDGTALEASLALLLLAFVLLFIWISERMNR